MSTRIKNYSRCHNIGQMIRDVIKERNLSVSDFAKSIHCSRTNVYSIFERQTISIERLEQIANVLKLDIHYFIREEQKAHKCIAVIEIDDQTLKELSEKTQILFYKVLENRVADYSLTV